MFSRYRKGPDGQWGYGININNNLPGAPPIEATTVSMETLNEYKYEMPDLTQDGRVVSFGTLPGEARHAHTTSGGWRRRLV